MNPKRSILVTGGAGYVGSALIPGLLTAGHKVTVLDLYLYGEDALRAVSGDAGLREVKGDLRDPEAVEDALSGGGGGGVIRLFIWPVFPMTRHTILILNLANRSTMTPSDRWFRQRKGLVSNASFMLRLQVYMALRTRPK